MMAFISISDRRLPNLITFVSLEFEVVGRRQSVNSVEVDVQSFGIPGYPRATVYGKAGVGKETVARGGRRVMTAHFNNDRAARIERRTYCTVLYFSVHLGTALFLSAL